MEKIKLYAPCDGMVFPIEKLNDGVFSEKMLGEGIYIEPSSNVFYSPFEKSTINLIFETKHAFFVKAQDGPNVLIHIGLDTVNLKGKPFKFISKINEEISLKDKIVEVDLKLIKENNLAISTPIVIQEDVNEKWKLKLKEGLTKVKQGDEIGYFELDQEVDILKNIDALFSINKYEKTAEEIYKNVGTSANYSKYYNCMTRFRLIVKNKSKVDLKAIEKIALVKGTHWNGEELQIIIGGEVQKVFTAFQNIDQKINEDKNEIKVKKPIKERIMASLAGVMVPNLPIFIGIGMLMAVQSILIQANVLTKPGFGVSLNDIDHFSQFFFIITDVAFKFLGLFVGYNTIRYLGGNSQMGLLICLVIANPYLFQNGQPIWEWFKIGDVAIGIKAYANTILPCIAAMIAYYWLDKWIKTWMPSMVDIIFRHTLAFLIVVVGTFFLVGPILGLFEYGIGYVVNQIGLIPFGIGVAIFAFVWQPAVVLGIHIAIAMPISLQVQQGIPQLLSPGLMYGVYGQVGALIGIIIRTKDAKLRAMSIASLPAGFIGVSEPILYGINLPKQKPFIAGNIGAAIGGMLSGIIGVKLHVPGGYGIFSITGYIPGGATNVAMFVLCLLVALGGGAVATILIYQERPDELKTVNKINKLLISAYASRKQISKKEAKLKLEQVLKSQNEFLKKEDLKWIKELEKEIIILNQKEAKFEQYQNKYEKKYNNYLIKLKKLRNSDNPQSLKILYLKFEDFKSNNKKEELTKEIEEYKVIVKNKSKWFDDKQDEFMKIVSQNTAKLAKELNFSNLTNIDGQYFNAIHSLDINYGLTNKVNQSLLKKDIKLKVVK
ncbi:glucose PTS transporter subunit IIA [Spiroplasma floricola]|uniref:PTS system, beta-glucoside IIABC component n=1 Tax=Spiroplasma floricola 23-6 TaxID=1336749 RepID=A0A2K8SE49_9MOLU|nr:glucose PTS transporter subunit IIA [Spiroplasma floricola]AUB31731.1 PTS system, beta-glucoside IIABC component [Spiroplasma floricola 23-6]